jgi:hypothetical protein
MGKLFSIAKNQIAILGTLMILIFLGACYFFVYVPNNEKTVQERRFRCLQNIDVNIKVKLNNNILLINNLLTTYALKNKAKPNNKDSIDKLNRYVANYPSKDFLLLPIELSGKKGRTSQIPGIDSLYTIKIDIDSNLQQFTLYVSKAIKKTDSTDWLRMGVLFGFEQFLKPLFPADVFDNYVVFDKDKRLYETFPSGLSYKTKDSLLQVNNGIISPGVHSLTVGGTDYKVFSQPVSIGNKEWIVAGFVSNKNYQKEKNQLPISIILLLFTAAIGMIVSLPWIKLYQMGNKDKLTVRDGISSILVSMLLMSFLFFVFFKYNFSLSDWRLPDSKTALAKKITTAFESELKIASRFLDSCDLLYATQKSDIGDLGKGNLKPDALFKNLLQPLDVQQIFWLDKKGIEQNNWTTGVKIPKGSDLSERAYFKSTINNTPNKTGADSYYVDQVVSRTTGIFESVIAKKTKNANAAVVAMTLNFQSLNNVIMPDGYQFAIIDNKGEVLYHYFPNRNLNENLKSELSDSSNLVSCIEAKSDTIFNADYFGRLQNIKIRPLPDLPYYTVIFEDLEYNDTRDTEAYIFTVSMLLCLMLFLIIQFSVIFFVSSKQSFFKKQLFDTSWIGPKTTSHHEYNLAILANLVIIVLLVIFFNLHSFLTYLYILLFSIMFISLFLNSIFAKKYVDENPYKCRFKMLAVYWLCFFILAIDIAACNTLQKENRLWLFLFEGLLIGICSILFYKGKDLLENSRGYKLKSHFPWTYTHSFALMATTRVIITSGIPVAFFFIYSFNYEQNLDTRYKQLRFADALTQKIPPSKITKAKLDSLYRGLSYMSGVYYDSAFINKIEFGKKDTQSYNAEDFLTVRILSAFRLNKNNVALKSSNMNLHFVDDKAYFNSLTHENKNRGHTTTTSYKIGPGKDKYIKLSSFNINYRPPGIFFWLLLVAAVIGFYYVIHNIIRKLFALNLPTTDQWNQMDDQILLDNELNRLLLIVGSPGSGKLSRLKEKICQGKLYCNVKKPYCEEEKADEKKTVEEKKLLVLNPNDPSKNNVFIADMILISAEGGEDDPDWKKCKKEALKEIYDLVIINHFEYNIKDVKTNSIKLNLLESLMHKGKSKVIIVSSVHPVNFLDSFNEQQTNPIPENELERWHVLLGHFRIIIARLRTSNIPKKGLSVTKRAIMEETQYTHYLNKMQKMTLLNIPPIQNIQDIGPVSDSLIFKIQLTSQYFYTYIWQSLTKEEKFLLYDLAEEGLVNPYDDYNLSMLMCKGLIIKPKGTLALFNKGFRNFILTAIGETEVKRIKSQVKDTGNWSNLKTPLNLAILAILVFLFASQQEAYSRIITYITALSAGVPAVLKVFSLFGNSNSQKTS